MYSIICNMINNWSRCFFKLRKKGRVDSSEMADSSELSKKQSRLHALYLVCWGIVTLGPISASQGVHYLMKCKKAIDNHSATQLLTTVNKLSAEEGGRCPRTDVLYVVVKSNWVEGTQALVPHCSQCINRTDRHEFMEAPLHAAVMNGNAGIVAILLEAGADAEVMLHRRTALHLALGVKRTVWPVEIYCERDIILEAGTLDQIIQLLLAHGANVERLSPYRLSPLYHAVLGNKMGAAKLLLQHDANVHVRNRQGDTLIKTLLMKWSEGREPLLQLLLSWHTPADDIVPVLDQAKSDWRNYCQVPSDVLRALLPEVLVRFIMKDMLGTSYSTQ